jgi:hypothetical protein
MYLLELILFIYSYFAGVASEIPFTPLPITLTIESERYTSPRALTTDHTLTLDEALAKQGTMKAPSYSIALTDCSRVSKFLNIALWSHAWWETGLEPRSSETLKRYINPEQLTTIQSTDLGFLSNNDITKAKACIFVTTLQLSKLINRLKEQELHRIAIVQQQPISNYEIQPLNAIFETHLIDGDEKMKKYLKILECRPKLQEKIKKFDASLKSNIYSTSSQTDMVDAFKNFMHHFDKSIVIND